MALNKLENTATLTVAVKQTENIKNEINAQKGTLANILTNRGASSQSSEKLSVLIDKVDTLETSKNITNLKLIESGTDNLTISYDIKNPFPIHLITVSESCTRKDITKEVISKGGDTFEFKITNLKPNTSYTIQIFNKKENGNEEGKSDFIILKTLKTIIYTIVIDKSKSSNPASCITAEDDAKGVAKATRTTLGGFANLEPFNKIKLVGLKNGVEVGDINPKNKKQYLDGTLVNSDTDVMVKFPKVYWNIERKSNLIYIHLSPIKINENYECYAHRIKVGESYVEKDNLYIGAYISSVDDNSTVIRSISGTRGNTSPYSTWREPSLSKINELLGNMASGYKIFSYWDVLMLQIYYLILFQNLNSQSVLGKGFVGVPKVDYPKAPSFNITGSTDTQGLMFGSTNAKQSICFLGVEDLWGNYTQLLTGTYTTDPNYTICVSKDNMHFSSESDYVPVYKHGTYEEGYATDVVGTSMGGFLPITCGGSTSTHWCDLSYIDKDSYPSGVQYGGHLSAGDTAGIFRILFFGEYTHYVPDPNNTKASRLAFL